MHFLSVIQWLEAHLLTCPVKSYSGMDCPGCGLQRSILLLFKGDLSASVAMHPAGIPIVMLIIITGLHLKFGFRNGARIITTLYILIAAITIIHYVYKISHGQVCTITSIASQTHL